jgi:hypothetical protein
VLNIYLATATKLAERGAPKNEASSKRDELAENLREELRAYYVEPADIDNFVKHGNLTYFNDDLLQHIIETIEPMQRMVRHFLLTLLDLDDKAEASAKRKEERDAEREVRAKEREERARERATRAQESAARAEERQEKMRERMAALRGEKS